MDGTLRATDNTSWQKEENLSGAINNTYGQKKDASGLNNTSWRRGSNAQGYKQHFLPKRGEMLQATKALPDKETLKAITALLDGEDGILRSMSSTSW